MVQKKGNTNIIQITEIKHNKNPNDYLEETGRVQIHSLLNEGSVDN